MNFYQFKKTLRSITPKAAISLYHFTLALAGAIKYRFPSRKMVVVGITGTKGKSSTTELVHVILSAAGYKTAAVGTIGFRIGDEFEPNRYKMTLPGRMFLQRFLRRALEEGCTHAVIELTSDGALQHRHRGLDLNALIFTNLTPEHLESSGGMAGYVAAKYRIARQLERSQKRPRIMVANADDVYGQHFLGAAVDRAIPFSLRDAEPYTADDESVRFVWRGALFSAPLPGVFNLYNILAALTVCDALGISVEVMQRALAKMHPIAGRAERIDAGQPFLVIVDYAHTPESLRALCETYKNHRIIGIFGSAGGGRDRAKRTTMGAIASEYADSAYLTNEDPYDEDPKRIIDDLATGFSGKAPHLVLDRREAIHRALSEAREGDAVLITGKGTDPYIMGAEGKKEPWSDAEVAREELAKLGYTK